MQQKYNVALIGSGYASQKQLALLQCMPEVVVKAVMDDHAINDYYFSDEDDIDAIIIAETSSNPIQFIESALQKNKHIFCSHHVLPHITMDCENAESLSNIINEHHIKIGFKRRFDPNHIYLKKQLTNGAIGHIHIVKMINRHDISYDINGIVNPFIFNLQDFDMAQFITGQKVDEVFAMCTAKTHDAAVMTLKMKNGALVVIDSSRSASYGHDQRLEVFGEKGALIVDNVTQTTTRQYTSSGVMTENSLENLDERYQRAYQFQLRSFINGISQTDHAFMPTLKDVVSAMRIAEAVERSIRENKAIKL